MEQQPIENKVQNSGLISLDMERMLAESNWIEYDLSQNLFQGLVLKERDFRQFIKEHDWEQYRDKKMCIVCSADAVIPVWVYMLLMTKLTGIAKRVIVGESEEELLRAKLFAEIELLDVESFADAKVVVKGCASIPNPQAAFLALSEKLLPHASSLMYGEPCSTVPIYKKKRGL